MARIVIWLFVAVPLLYLLFVLGMRQMPPTPEQRRALALLEAPTPPVAGRDGTNAIWLADHAVPVTQQAEIGKRYRAYLQRMDRPDGSPPPADPLAKFAPFPKPPPGGDGVCEEHTPGCLAYVRDNQAKVRETLAAHQPRLRAALAMAQFDGLRYGMSPSLTLEFPRFNGINRLARTHFAHEFVAGRPVEAIDGLCRNIAGWRRLGANADYLIASMVGAGAVRQDLPLLADMLLALPAGEPLPASCTEALAATRDEELSLCAAMRTEFGFMKDVPVQMGEAPPGESLLQQRWMLDYKHLQAMSAERLSLYCEPALLQAARDDRSVTALIPPPAKCPVLRKAADPVGCILAELGTADHSRYADRRTDQAAMLALMRAVVWLRGQAASPDEITAALRRLPPALGLRRTPAFDAGKRTLAIPMLETSRGMVFELPLPAAPTD